MSDIADLAEAREAELRADALEAMRRKQREAALQPSAEECRECGDEIPAERQQAVCGVQYCVQCQNRLEKIKAGKR